MKNLNPEIFTAIFFLGAVLMVYVMVLLRFRTKQEMENEMQRHHEIRELIEQERKLISNAIEDVEEISRTSMVDKSLVTDCRDRLESVEQIQAEIDEKIMP